MYIQYCISLYLDISEYIYIYLYISIYIYRKKERGLGMACVLFKRTQRSAFFCVLLQKNVAFFVFFYVPKKRMQRTHRSFGFHMSPKT